MFLQTLLITGLPLLCEAVFFGLPNFMKVPVNSGNSSAVYGPTYPLENSWDDNPSTLFHSESNSGGWAKYNFPESNVTLVRLQNRADCCEDRMTNNIVYVCGDSSDASCQECGRVTGLIWRSQWAETACEIGGSVVKVVAPTSYLQIAEIEIYSEGEQGSENIDGGGGDEGLGGDGNNTDIAIIIFIGVAGGLGLLVLAGGVIAFKFTAG